MNRICIITSVIDFKEKPLSYSAKRSVFPAEERLKQTEETISSVRKYIPGAKIILIEAGVTNVADKIEGNVDKYVYLGKNWIVRLACDSKHKGLGEAISLLYGYKHIREMDGEYYFKISGRYFLNDRFDITVWEALDKATVTISNGVISTRLYGLPRSLLRSWKFLLLRSLPLLWWRRSIEEVLAEKVPRQSLNVVDTLGVSGLIGPTGETIQE